MYNHRKIEQKWQEQWQRDGLYEVKEIAGKDKYYVLDMFPYPSGVGLHVGHPRGYIATDVIARYKQFKGFNVLHPMGWDAFGLPAENYALAQKTHPKKSTDANIANYKRQLGLLGFNYDWSREINTTDPAYYKWTQWAFIQMFNKGLVYESHEPINWCPTCLTGLANEDVEDGRCERCGTPVEKRPLRQWVIRITDYAERLLKDLDKLKDWEEPIKEMQRNWLGKSDGAIVKFSVIPAACPPLQARRCGREAGIQTEVEVFTTRPDTIFGATYLVLAPEHELIKNYELRIKNYGEVEKYIKKIKNKSDLERTDLNKDKTGVELKGIKAINPATKEEIPVWVADYVLPNYGTGAIMAVPAHDERDFEFAKKYELPIKQVVAPIRIDAKNPPREDKPTVIRRTIHGLVLNPKTGKILCLKWKQQPWTGFIVGGVDDGEDIVEAAKREIKEETGYTNLKLIRVLGGVVRGEYFAAHKDENRLAYTNAVLFELAGEEQEPISVEEQAKHEPIWLDPKTLNHDNFTCAELDLWFERLANDQERADSGYGAAINSDFLDNLETIEAKEAMIKWLEKNGLGRRQINWRLKDWVFSRQRYWGEPIPLIHCDKDGVVPVPEKDLPLTLPEVEHYEPSGTGESPLANITDWVNTTCPKCGGPAKRETNTMPQWAGSSWYYLRYCDPHNDQELIAKSKEKYWLGQSIACLPGEAGVDCYVGGAEHATRHLIYARFWHKFLRDINVVSGDEPFVKYRHVGLILAEDNRKMSKRWNNVINPDDIVISHGADALRVYEMFMGPFGEAIAWNTNGLSGARKFLEKVYKLKDKVSELKTATPAYAKLLHKTIKKVGADIEGFKFNTAISALMILLNKLNEEAVIDKEDFKRFLLILAPFAPHLAEELWQEQMSGESIFKQPWPEFDFTLAQDELINLVIQINGKLRDTIEAPADISEGAAKELALKSDKIIKWLDGKTPEQVIYVKGRLVNIVVK